MSPAPLRRVKTLAFAYHLALSWLASSMPNVLSPTSPLTSTHIYMQLLLLLSICCLFTHTTSILHASPLSAYFTLTLPCIQNRLHPLGSSAYSVPLDSYHHFEITSTRAAKRAGLCRETMNWDEAAADCFDVGVWVAANNRNVSAFIATSSHTPTPNPNSVLHNNATHPLKSASQF